MSGLVRRRGALAPLGITVVLTLGGCGPAGSPSGVPLQTLAEAAEAPFEAPDLATEAPLEAPEIDEATAPPEEEGDELVRSLGLIASLSQDESFHKGIGEVIVTLAKADKAMLATRVDQALGHLRLANYQFQAIDVSSLNEQALKAIPMIDQAIEERIAQLEAIRQQAG